MKEEGMEKGKDEREPARVTEVFDRENKDKTEKGDMGEKL